jgi:hypothetical protein
MDSQGKVKSVFFFLYFNFEISDSKNEFAFYMSLLNMLKHIPQFETSHVSL